MIIITYVLDRAGRLVRTGFAGGMLDRHTFASSHIAVRHQPAAAGRTVQAPAQQADIQLAVIDWVPSDDVVSCWVDRTDQVAVGAELPDQTARLPDAGVLPLACASSLLPSCAASTLCGFLEIG